MAADRKLVLCVVDSLRTDMLERAVLGGKAPHFGALLERGRLIGDCVSAFPSVTPVCSAEIVTGERGDGHHIAGMNWYHRAEGRYVEYGSSLEATRAFGLFRSLYDIVYNMNLAHLSPEVETVFERLGDHGIRTACTPFLIYRGRTRHELGLEGMLRRVAVAASFRHATWGPDELFYGELYASRRVPCKPTLARPGTRDPYSACVGRELVAEDLYDFLLYSLPDNDYHSHRFGPEAQLESIARADDAFGELVDAGGGHRPVLGAELRVAARRPRTVASGVGAAAGRGAGRGVAGARAQRRRPHTCRACGQPYGPRGRRLRPRRWHSPRPGARAGSRPGA
jgi:predicted AlkP superfamily pyrophosphatase or phosphodiesterase